MTRSGRATVAKNLTRMHLRELAAPRRVRVAENSVRNPQVNFRCVTVGSILGQLNYENGSKPLRNRHKTGSQEKSRGEFEK